LAGGTVMPGAQREDGDLNTDRFPTGYTLSALAHLRGEARLPGSCRRCEDEIEWRLERQGWDPVFGPPS